MVFKKEDIERFVDEWKDAPGGEESFACVCRNYPKEFNETWKEIGNDDLLELETWDDYKQEMVKRLYVARTKLGRALS